MLRDGFARASEGRAALALIGGEPGIGKTALDGEIAERLGVKRRTVTTHLSSVYSKLGVSSRAAATRIAIEQGLI